MSRKEEILKAANSYAKEETEIYHEYYTDDEVRQFAAHHSDSFVAGAEWADKNPESQYNISDTDYVVSMIESALTSAEHLTTGNLAHNKAAIMLQLREALKCITTLK